MRRSFVPAVLAFLSTPFVASAFSVTPIRNDVAAGGATTVTVKNAGSDKPLAYEATMIRRVLDEAGMTGEAPAEDDFVVVPPAGVVLAGSSQAIRVQYVGEAGTERSQHYFLNVREVPVEIAEDGAPPPPGVRARLNVAFAYNVAVNVAPPGAAPDVRLVSVKGGKTVEADGKRVPAIEIVAENDGAKHAYLDDFRLEVTAKDGKPVLFAAERLENVASTPLMPGMARRAFLLPVAEGRFADGPLSAKLY
jgi:fimbrial chaperone protein